MNAQSATASLDKEQYLVHLIQLLLAWRKSFCSIDQKTMTDLMGPDLFPKLFGRLLFMVVENSDHARLMNEIHSETTVNERRFLYNFFANVWSGKSNVLEIGPFLGGTTRAIALGMASNPNLGPRSRLQTFDRFSDYYKGEQFDSLVRSLVEGGAIEPQMRERLRESTSFREIFTVLHQGHEYYSLVDVDERVLPETAQDVSSLDNLFTLEEGLEYDAVFVDGCKGWYSTKHFMREAARRTRPGAYFIFQDYGWYTCFWIPAFLTIMKRFFRLVAFVDNTYTFQLTQEMDVPELEENFPDTPDELGEVSINALFNQMIGEATMRDDGYARFVHHLHHAAALAYIGNTSGAKARLNEVASRPNPPGHRDLIQRSFRSPTYNPQGPIYL